MKSIISLFMTGFLQVTFVSMNIMYISKGMILPMLITGALISLIWTINVSKIAFGGWRDRWIYVAGATAGTGFGYYLSHLLLHYYKEL